MRSWAAAGGWSSFFPFVAALTKVRDVEVWALVVNEEAVDAVDEILLILGPSGQSEFLNVLGTNMRPFWPGTSFGTGQKGSVRRGPVTNRTGFFRVFPLAGAGVVRPRSVMTSPNPLSTFSNRFFPGFDRVLTGIFPVFEKKNLVQFSPTPSMADPFSQFPTSKSLKKYIGHSWGHV